MPTSLTYPGVYIEETPSGVRTITGVATSITAFIGRARRGPVNTPMLVHSLAEFNRLFGSLWQASTMSYSVSHFFQNGGSSALIVRVFHGDEDDSTANISLPTPGEDFVLEASSPGMWGQALRAKVDHATRDPADDSLFNLTIEELDRPQGDKVVATESFRNVSVSTASSRFVKTVIDEQSTLVNVEVSANYARPLEPADPANPYVTAEGTVNDDGGDLVDNDITGDANNRTGIYALDSADLFNLLCIPPLDGERDLDSGTWAVAANYCQQRRAMLIIDPPQSWSANAGTAIRDAKTGVNALRAVIGNDDARNAMTYFPRLKMSDPLSENRPAEFAPCGAIAGAIARTDAQRGVWKAPAGLETSLSGVRGFSYTMTDKQNGVLNPVGLNCLRTFPVAGNLVWGARTLAGADVLASEWKYVPVRRLALFIEETLYRNTQWIVFEPNDEPLWAQIRLNVGAFMQDLFRQGAFQGASPREAYRVRCDKETTTQNDIDRGIVNIEVGFAPLKPAEFVVIKIQQIAGQIEA